MRRIKHGSGPGRWRWVVGRTFAWLNQSRRRRQHVIPDPQPSSCGSICQGMPLRRTNRMPVRHARSETRGRPPSADEVELVRTVQPDPTTDRAAAPGPYPFTLLRRPGSRFDGFVTRSQDFSLAPLLKICHRRDAPRFDGRHQRTQNAAGASETEKCLQQGRRIRGIIALNPGVQRTTGATGPVRSADSRATGPPAWFPRRRNGWKNRPIHPAGTCSSIP
jgi:hypothetical protein